MGNKNYNNFYNGNRNHNNAKHSHAVPNVETPVEEVKEMEMENVNDTIVESTDPSTVETTPIPGMNENSEETVSNESEFKENQNESEVDETTPENSSEEKRDTQNVRVTIKALNIRKEASKDSAVVVIAHEGDELMLMNSEVVNGFYSVVTSNGEQGYCMVEFVELV